MNLSFNVKEKERVASHHRALSLFHPLPFALTRVCMAQYENNFNTWAFNGGNSNGSSDYGIFQRNKWWCKDNRHSSENACNVMCNKFMNDDIDDDIHCAKTVVKDPNGMSAWVAWVHCKDLDLSKYLASCKLSDCL
ncbi:LOW QUALITY PROTEIN: lysozyme C, milk isozyme-like [Trichechus inunguis]